MEPKTLLGLIICNLIWSANPVMGKLALEDLGSIHAAWVRYLCALAAYVLGVLFIRTRAPNSSPVFFLRPLDRSDWFLLAGIGLTTFCLSPLMQMVGLGWSRATDNSLIIAMEPLITVFLAWIFLGEGMDRKLVTCFSVALAGFFLLSGFSASELYLGNLIILFSLTGEAAYSVLGRKLIQRYSPFGIFGTGLTLGVFLMTGALLISGVGKFQERCRIYFQAA